MPPSETLLVPPQSGASAAHAGDDGWVTLDGQDMYRICDFDQMPPFLMSIVSDSDLWMYLSSNGGLTAGRVSAAGSLFPYVTDDKLHQCHSHTGPVTVFRVQKGGNEILWEPFRQRADGHDVRRNLYKNAVGNSVVFEEINATLGLTFRYRWATSDAYGFIRTATLSNEGNAAVDLKLLDGVINLIPACVALGLQQTLSCLVNAYTRCEVDAQTSMGLYALQAVIVDQAKPAEALRATAVWSRGLPHPAVLLSPEQIAAFRHGQDVIAESIRTGRSGAYLTAASIHLKPHESKQWQLLADVERSQVQVEAMRAAILKNKNLDADIAASVAAGDINLRRNVASADGLQSTADHMASAHHFTNVLFNNMRGGVFVKNYSLPAADFAAFVRARNSKVAATRAEFLTSLRGELDYHQLLAKVKAVSDVDLLRLAHEYLPLTFGRRHGDPSRPWNQFTIHVKNEDGSQALNYQGNWRDIFQNWEAMSHSFPDFIESIIAKFVNASTIDGFNPYRITRDGIDWEAPDPEDPWSYIGYWGDHQIIYLLKFLEASRQFHPDALEQMLSNPIYSYADVPYRIKSYDAIVRNPRSTIDFDHALEKRIEKRVAEMGSDGKLLPAPGGGIYHVTLAEKLLVPALSKLSNLVIDGGIWMNTQRPEWNDANNALVGNGISMVTLCHLHRYLAFCADLFDAAQKHSPGKMTISAEVAKWFSNIADVLRHHRPLLDTAEISDTDRKHVLDALGTAFGNYRQHVYTHGFSGQSTLPLSEITALFRLANEYLRHAIHANRRPDGLYHSYNLLHFSADGHGAAIDRLYEMLEGQVAVLNSGVLSAKESAALLEALFASRMYRQDQQSFMLYPNRELPGFLQKNQIPAETITSNPLLSALIDSGDTSVVARDAFDQYRFNANFRSAEDLEKALDTLAAIEKWKPLVAAHRAATSHTYEQIFHHRSFTGRSGSMYGYEGLGCIYWHMVAKLLLATQECYQSAAQANPAAPETSALSKLYYRVRTGLGFNKSARQYGAFPIDPYSHTPGHSGAQQPGMTGQVKEEVLSRMGELGIMVNNGELSFQPRLLRLQEFFAASQSASQFTYYDTAGESRTLPLPPASLAFTICQTLVVYTLSDSETTIKIHRADGTVTTIRGNKLDTKSTRDILSRNAQITRLDVTIPRAGLL